MSEASTDRRTPPYRPSIELQRTLSQTLERRLPTRWGPTRWGAGFWRERRQGTHAELTRWLGRGPRGTGNPRAVCRVAWGPALAGRRRRHSGRGTKAGERGGGEWGGAHTKAVGNGSDRRLRQRQKVCGASQARPFNCLDCNFGANEVSEASATGKASAYRQRSWTPPPSDTPQPSLNCSSTVPQPSLNRPSTAPQTSLSRPSLLEESIPGV